MNELDKITAAPEPPSFRSKWLMLVVSAILLLSLAGFERYESYRNIQNTEIARLQTLTRATDANLLIHLTTIDRLLLHLRDTQLTAELNSRGGASTLPSNDELQFFVQTTPGVRTLAIINDKGTFLASNRPELIGKNFAERPYFRAAQQTRDPKTLLVSEPFITSLNQWGLTLVRPLISSEGRFLGAVLATLDAGFFKTMLTSTLYAQDLRCLLIHQDGVVFESVGDFKAKIGTNLAEPGSLLTSHLASGQQESSVIQKSYSTGDRRIGVLRNVQLDGMDKHFVITFTRNYTEVFANWYKEMLVGTLGFLASFLLSAAWLRNQQRLAMTAYRDNQALHQERFASAEAKQQANREIERLYNNAPCGYHFLDAEGTIQRINQTELDWLGLQREDVEGKLRFIELLDNEGVEAFHKNSSILMQEGFVKDWELTLRRHDGNPFTVLVTATALRSDDGAYMGSQASLTDISQRKAFEIALKTSEAKMRGLFELSPLGIALTDMQGHYIEFNDAFQNICGYTHEELNALDYWELTPKKYEADEQRQLASLIETGYYGPYEKEYRRKDGSLIPLSLNGMLITGSDGKQYIWSLVEDITERKSVERELDRHRHHLEELVDKRTHALEIAKEQAESANRAKSLFLGNMSHEMRTPIHQISGISGLLRIGPLTDKQSKYLDMQDTAVERLNTVIGGILTLVDLESGSRSVKLAPCNPNAIIQHVVTSLSERATPKGLRLDFLESQLPANLLGDANNIQTIAMCYCSNAITFSERGSIQLRLACVREDAGSILLRLEVKDEGIGIAPDIQERLFDYFEQADSSHTRKYGGTGVGLSIARRLARLMGGDAGCESAPGVGSTFWATFVMTKEVGDSATNFEEHGDYVI